MLGLTPEKLVVVAVIAVLLVGPERLPGLAAGLAGLVKRVRALGREAEARIREEVGPEFDEVDWRRLDPRRYDPRRIIRDALADEPSHPDPAPHSRGARTGPGHGPKE